MAKHLVALRLDDQAFDLLGVWAARTRRSRAAAAEVIVASFLTVDDALPITLAEDFSECRQTDACLCSACRANKYPDA